MTHTTREGWLQEAMNHPRLGLAPWIKERTGLVIAHTVGFSLFDEKARPAGSKSAGKIGLCLPRLWSEGEWSEIRISSGIGPEDVLSPYGVLATELHELVHAVLPAGVKHGKPFRDAALACQLTGKMTSTYATDELLGGRLKRLSEELGPYPHAIVKPAKPIQRGRQIKVVCACTPEHVARMSRTQYETAPWSCSDCDSFLMEA